MASQWLGVDAGGTHLRAAWVTEDGQVVAGARRPWRERSPEAVAKQMASLIDEELGGLGDNQNPVGVGLAAQLNAESGFVAQSPNLGWHDVPFGELLSKELERPVRLINDVNAITVGEAAAGAAQGQAHVFCVFVGTGVGTGVLCDGRLLEGADGLAAELGHIKVESPLTGRLCGCGMRGCLEAYTGGTHLPQLLAELVSTGAPWSADPRDANAVVIEEAAVHGDPTANTLWNQVSTRLAQGISIGITLFNPRVLVLGGGVLERAPTLAQRVRDQLSAFLTPPYLRDLLVIDSKLGDTAGVVGAAINAAKLG